MRTERPRSPGARPHLGPPVAFVAWTSAPERAREIAAALGGLSFCHYPLGHVRAITPLRYVFSAILTAAFLARRRPRAVIVTNPPIFPALIALVYARLVRVPVLLDSHPGGFGLQGDRLSAKMQPVVRWVARRADATLVTERSLQERVEGWGGRGQIVHEAPPEWDRSQTPARGETPEVLFVCTFGRDEPVSAFVEAAGQLPEVAFKVTGDLRKAPDGLAEAAPANVSFVGFLRGRDYPAALASADLIVVLTTEPTSVVKAGYEAVYAERPLLLSDWSAGREAFPLSAFAHNSSTALARGISAALENIEAMRSRTQEARLRQETRWTEQRQALEQLIGT